MATIDTSAPALMALIERIQVEHGTTVVANFALDMQLNRAEATIKMFHENTANLNREKAEMQAIINQLRADNEELKLKADPTRKERRKAISNVAERRAERVNGTDQNQPD